MLSCKEISKLVSESLDHDLSLWQRVNLWLHMSMCRLCSGFRNDLVHLHEETRELGRQFERDAEGETDIRLSAESRDRIKQRLESRGA